ncbi:MAG: SUMF1/EgtB/PvdO family nonheme iron enzyme [Candidatus Parabeggiatoa sp.]|nr:SUMF1/EgtB/PvdO family nonheme iron enzyme [Candidatus Parabeggiatoa sp.]
MKKIFKVLFYLLLAIYMNGCLTWPPGDSTESCGVSTKSEAKKAIVKITSQNDEGSRQTCTGFVIAQNEKNVYIVTAAHVIEGDPTPKVHFPEPTCETLDVKKGNYKASGKHIDVAVLWVRTPPDNTFSPLPTHCISKNFDLNEEDNVFTYDNSSQYAKLHYSSQTNDGYIFRGDQIAPGFSGSPLLNQKHKKLRVVGMISSSSPEVKSAGIPHILHFIESVNPEILVLMRKGSTTIPSFPTSPSSNGNSNVDKNGKNAEVPQEEPNLPDMPEMLSIKGNFEISKYEITLKQYKYFCTQTDRHCPVSPEPWMKDNMPVVYVSWNDAVAYTKWLSEETGETYRLPTAEEWTLAAQGSSERTDYFWGNNPSQVCQYANGDTKNKHSSFKCSDNDEYLAPVDSPDYKPNDFGLYHILGNAAEWTSKCTKFDKCIVRGGSWRSLKPKNLYISEERSEERKKIKTNSGHEIGFRVVKVVKELIN